MAEWEWTCICGQKLRTQTIAIGEAPSFGLCAACEEAQAKREQQEADEENEAVEEALHSRPRPKRR